MTVKVEKCPCCGGDAVNRSFFWEAVVENGDQLKYQIYLIERAIKKYFLALDRREHAGVAQDKAFREIQIAMGLEWKQGEMTEFLNNHPKLKKLYGVDENCGAVNSQVPEDQEEGEE